MIKLRWPCYISFTELFRKGRSPHSSETLCRMRYKLILQYQPGKYVHASMIIKNRVIKCQSVLWFQCKSRRDNKWWDLSWSILIITYWLKLQKQFKMYRSHKMKKSINWSNEFMVLYYIINVSFCVGFMFYR